MVRRGAQLRINGLVNDKLDSHPGFQVEAPVLCVSTPRAASGALRGGLTLGKNNHGTDLEAVSKPQCVLS